MAAREGSDNPEWIKCKKEVDKRDRNTCRCCRLFTPGEMLAFRKSRPGPQYPLQHAHRHPVSVHPDEAHDPNNVCLLCRTCHSRIDGFLDPITGNPISEEEHERWWDRIWADINN